MNKLALVLNRLMHNVADAKKVRETLAQKILSGDSEAVYQIRWLEGKTATLQIGAWSQEILDQVEGGRDIASLRAAIVSKQQSWRPTHSSSPFANAVNSEEFNAIRELLELLDRAI